MDRSSPFLTPDAQTPEEIRARWHALFFEGGVDELPADAEHPDVLRLRWHRLFWAEAPRQIA